MTSDTTTFFIAFTAVFAGIAWLLWRIERHASQLEGRIEALEALHVIEARRDANAKNPGAPRPPEP